MSSGPTIPRRDRKSPRREFTLPADVASELDALPHGERSRVVAAGLRLLLAVPPETRARLMALTADEAAEIATAIERALRR